MHSYEASSLIQATPERVWSVLTDAAAWPNWDSGVTKVDGRHLEFKVSARDEIEEIGNGTHERMVVDMARLDQRLKAKKRP